MTLVRYIVWRIRLQAPLGLATPPIGSPRPSFRYRYKTTSTSWIPCWTSSSQLTELSSRAAKIFGDLKSDDQVQKLQALLKSAWCSVVSNRMSGNLSLPKRKRSSNLNLRTCKSSITEESWSAISPSWPKVRYNKHLKVWVFGSFHNVSIYSHSGTTKANVPCNVPNVPNLMNMRKCCIHLYLLNGAE